MTHSVHTALSVGAVSAALALAACGSSDRQTPSLDLPITAPAGASGVMADFIEVCSLSLVDHTAAISELNARGWQAPSVDDAEMMAAFGGYASESENGEQLQIFAIDFPHVAGTNCMISSSYFDEVPNFSHLTNVPGLLGDIVSFGDGDDTGQLGRFSGIGPDGHPITIQVLSNADRFFNLAMTITRPNKPSVSNQE